MTPLRRADLGRRRTAGALDWPAPARAQGDEVKGQAGTGKSRLVHASPAFDPNVDCPRTVLKKTPAQYMRGSPILAISNLPLHGARSEQASPAEGEGVCCMRALALAGGSTPPPTPLPRLCSGTQIAARAPVESRLVDAQPAVLGGGARGRQRMSEARIFLFLRCARNRTYAMGRAKTLALDRRRDAGSWSRAW